MITNEQRMKLNSFVECGKCYHKGSLREVLNGHISEYGIVINFKEGDHAEIDECFEELDDDWMKELDSCIDEINKATKIINEQTSKFSEIALKFQGFK